MPKSIAGTNPCKRKPTPSPIAIQTPILRNTMSRNRNRERTSFSFSLACWTALPATVTPPDAHNDDGDLLPQAGLSPCLFPVVRQLGLGGNPYRVTDGYESGGNRGYTQ